MAKGRKGSSKISSLPIPYRFPFDAELMASMKQNYRKYLTTEVKPGHTADRCPRAAQEPEGWGDHLPAFLFWWDQAEPGRKETPWPGPGKWEKNGGKFKSAGQKDKDLLTVS
jgi:hypothetical protein